MMQDFVPHLFHEASKAILPWLPNIERFQMQHLYVLSDLRNFILVPKVTSNHACQVLQHWGLTNLYHPAQCNNFDHFQTSCNIMLKCCTLHHGWQDNTTSSCNQICRLASA